MTAFTIQNVSRRSGLSEPTLRYYEEVGLIGPVDRDGSSGHRRYSNEDVDALQMLACLRDKAAVWDARDRGDELAEAAAWERVRVVVERMEVAR